jgi:4-diphosphocytidyl-2-C-methyl-D-erythritol kinase
VVIFPNCKINLGLNVIRKREDGYHDLQTVFYPVNLFDALEIIKYNDGADEEVLLSTTGISINGNLKDNLCIKAYYLLKKDFPQITAIKMHLHKTIPLGAGLGGGSADAAFTLLLLNKKFQLNISVSQLVNYALQLGSDCPFFVINKPCYAQGRGEVLEEINLDLSPYQLLIVKPEIDISTRWAFSKIQPEMSAISIRQIVEGPIRSWKEYLKNDFEKPLMQYYPKLKSIKEELYTQGALYAGMSGSGSTFFGIFSESQKIDTTIFPSEYFIKNLKETANLSVEK